MEKGNIISLNSLQLFSKWLQNHHYQNIFILLDENSIEYCLPVLLSKVKALSKSHIIEIRSGEKAKDIATCEYIWAELLDKNADRDALIINLGGGLITDLGGFASSVYKRGIHFVNIPTTLIGMVDAAIGGKTGINFKSIKNQIGVFSSPELVVVCTQFLTTLSQNHLLSGFGEMLKYGLALDKDLWNDLKKLNTDSLLNLDEKLIYRCLEIKKAVVQKDFYEENFRKVLNFGHTIGHALESFFLEKNIILSHGEAVAHGLLIESIIANQAGILSDSDLQEIDSEMKRRFSKLSLHPLDFERLHEIMLFDKKNQNAVVNFTLLKSIGEAQIDNFISKKGIIEALERYIKS